MCWQLFQLISILFIQFSRNIVTFYSGGSMIWGNFTAFYNGKNSNVTFYCSNVIGEYKYTYCISAVFYTRPDEREILANFFFIQSINIYTEAQNLLQVHIYTQLHAYMWLHMYVSDYSGHLRVFLSVCHYLYVCLFPLSMRFYFKMCVYM